MNTEVVSLCLEVAAERRPTSECRRGGHNANGGAAAVGGSLSAGRVTAGQGARFYRGHQQHLETHRDTTAALVSWNQSASSRQKDFRGNVFCTSAWFFLQIH